MKKAYLSGLILSIILVLIYLFQESYQDFMHLFSEVAPPFTACTAMIASAFALRKYWGNPGDKFSRIWLGFTLGMAFWFLATVGWTVYSLLFNAKTPYPSIADVIWLIGYIPLIAASELYLRAFRFAISKTMYAVTVITVSITSLALFTFLTSSILAASSEKIPTLMTDLAYLALDLTLFSLAILGLLVFARGKIGLVWFLLNGAILMSVIGDLLFSYTTLQGSYYNGHFLELFYYWGYILFILAVETHTKEL